MNSYNGFTPYQRNKAYQWLKVQYEMGFRQKPTRCDICGQTQGKFMAHDEDYSEPYGDHIGQFGLCFACHMMTHCRYRSPARFEEYRRAVESGYIFGPQYRFDQFARLYLGDKLPLSEAHFRTEEEAPRLTFAEMLAHAPNR